MNLLMIPVVFTALLAAPVYAAPSPSNSPEGLVAVPSRTLDEFHVRPKADLSGYRKVIIDTPQVALTKGWLKSMNGTRDLQRWLYPQDAQRVTDDAVVGMGNAVSDAFRSRGYEVVTAPGAGVLRLSPSVVDLYVIAPDVPGSGLTRTYTKDSAGEATLILDARDSVTGTLVGRVVDRNTSREVGRFNYADRVTNAYWLDAMFRAWALNCATGFETAQAAP
ncbi:MAG: DUF3313 family protein [Betaproteobacteria bacterium]